MRRLSLPPWSPRLTRRGWMFLGVGVAFGVFAIPSGQHDLLFIAGLLVSIPVVALGYVTIRPGQVELTRTFRPPIVSAGEETVVSLHLRNLSFRPLDGASWSDPLPPGMGVPGLAASTPSLLPGLERYQPGPATLPDSVRLEYSVTPRIRGVYAFGPLLLGRTDPFGLAVREHPVGQPHDLVVTPRVTPLAATGVSVTRSDGSVRDLLRSLNPMSDELIAREYRPGDPFRRVNWPATARHGQIMVRQEEQRSNPEARIILDTTLNSHSAIERARRLDLAFELAIEIVASIGVYLLDSGLKVQLVETGPSQLVPGSDQNLGGLGGDAPLVCSAPGGDRELLEGLANLLPVAAPTDAGGSPGSSGGALPTFAVIVALSEADAALFALLRAGCEPAIAFVLEPVSAVARSILRDAGWRCIDVHSTRDIPQAWTSALSGREPEPRSVDAWEALGFDND
ncbi:DUF58 domain-containing protein [Cryobacterium sp. CG_9.6]|uniref:DUF58 domain-containing protein n=1 Tax=Cryobacterium sp. CG_9.6 TaxID=2760710 RepID=UPI0024736F30|nr:DUF58 domain-containing protein [Cryobacterium sp. CG_9.6]MDH6237524.1 uncharacterized protein (DUF58 family) [Cryobacterium sp. CG_9.6]